MRYLIVAVAVVVAMLAFSGSRLAGALSQLAAITKQGAGASTSVSSIERVVERRQTAPAPAVAEARRGSDSGAFPGSFAERQPDPAAKQLRADGAFREPFGEDDEIRRNLVADPAFMRGAAELLRDPDSGVRREAAELLRSFGAEVENVSE